MNGIVLSILSGVFFGLFQTINRRAGRKANVYEATFILLLVSSLVLALVSAIYEDLSLLRGLPFGAVAYFSTAALIHFFIGWTLFSASQKRVGAARTSALLGTVPLWATIIGLFFFDEFLSPIIFAGIFLIIAGTYIVTTARANAANAAIQTGFVASLYGLGTAVCFAGSSIFIRYGLELLPSPILGVTIGMIVVTIAYGVLFWIQTRGQANYERMTGEQLWLQLIAGVLVAVATWWRWEALDLAAIAVVIALSRVSVPTVLVLSPFMIGQSWEQVTVRVWLGAGVILAGAVILTFF